jgi:hypothetical protein
MVAASTIGYGVFNKSVILVETMCSKITMIRAFSLNLRGLYGQIRLGALRARWYEVSE